MSFELDSRIRSRYAGGMEQLFRLLIRMAVVIRRKPSRERMIILAVTIGIALVIGAVEALGLWPDALTLRK